MKKVLRCAFTRILLSCLILPHARAELGPGWFGSEVIEPPSAGQPGGASTPFSASSGLPSPDIQPLALVSGPSAKAVTPELQALASGLNNDPVAIFNYVRNKITFQPYYGSCKGAHTTYLDAAGNDMDQASLLIALLNAAGYSNTSYVYGKITMRESATDGNDLSHWLATNPATTSWVLANAGFPNLNGINYGSYTTWTFDHVWVRVVIGGTTYDIDPSYKPSDLFSGIDCKTISGYSRAQLVTDAAGTTGTNYVQNVNRSAVENRLGSYASALRTHIKTNLPNATTEEIIGGGKISEQNVAGLSAAAAILSGFSPTVTTTFTTIPSQYQATLTVKVGTQIDATFNADSLQARRLSLIFVGSNAQLWLADSMVASETNGSGANASVTLSVTHPFAPRSQNLGAINYLRSGRFDLSYAFYPNPFSNGQIDASDRRLREYLASGLTDTSRQVLTESLHGLGLKWVRRAGLGNAFVARLSGCYTWQDHAIGRTGQESGYYVDMPGLVTPVFNSSGSQPAVFSASTFTMSAMEHGAIEQNGGSAAASTIKCLVLASDGGQRIYRANSANWSSISSLLNNYTTAERNHIGSYASVSGYTVLLHQNGNTGLNDWEGYGFAALNTNFGAMLISGNLSGAYNSLIEEISGVFLDGFNAAFSEGLFSPANVAQAFGADPVDLATGAFTLTATDLALGETGTPRGLALSRSYDSSRSSQATALGNGWRHSCDGKVLVNSDLDAAFGVRQPTDAVQTIVAALALQDFTDTAYPAKELLIGALTANWLVNRVTNNAANVQLGEQRLTYISLPGGSWNPPPGATTSLTGSTGTFLLQPRFGGSVAFDAQNRVSQWKDVDNNTQTYVYDAQGRLSTVTDSQNRVLTFAYSGTNPLIQNVSDGTGRTVVFSYTGKNLTGVQDVENYNTTYVYDGRNCLLDWKDHSGAFIVRNTYGFGDDRVTEQRSKGDPNRLWKLRYSPGVTEEEDPLGHVTTHFFDGKFRRVGIEDPLGNTSFIKYDGQNHIVETTDGSGRKNSFVFDSNNNLTHATDNDGKTTVHQYDASLRLWRVFDPTNRITEFIYDSENHLKTVKDPGLRVTTFNYRADGRIDRITDNDNKAMIVTAFDQWANPTHVTRPDNTTTVSVFNARGDRTSFTDGRNHISYFGHDKRRLLTSFTDAENKSASFTYDCNGYPENKTDRNTETTVFDYDTIGKLQSISAPDTGLVQYGYDYRDKQTSITDGLNHTWDFGFDAAGRPKTVTDPLTIVTSQLFYDGAGRVSEQWNGLNQKNKSFYDTAGRLDYTLDPLNRRVDFDNDDAGRPLTLENRLGRTFTTEYATDGLPFRFYRPSGAYSEITERDPVGRPKTVREPSGQETSLTYDGMGRPKTKTDQLGAITWNYDGEGNPEDVIAGTDTINRSFDNVGRVETCTDTLNNTVSYTYDYEGNVQTITYPGNKTVTYGYDGANRLKTVTDWDNRLTEYFYDDAGRLRRVERQNGTQQRLEYDNANRLRETFEEKGTVSIWTGSYGYSNAYRLMTYVPTPPTRSFAPVPASMGYNLDNQLVSYNGQTVGSDLDGNMQAAPLNGTLLGAVGFDARNRLTSAGGISYLYDAENRRVRSTQNSQNTFYTWSRGQKLDRLLVKTNPDGSVTRYIHGLGLLYEETTPAGGGAATTLYYHYNWQGSTVALSDASGTVTARMSYSPYGDCTVEDGTVETPFRFNGQYGVMTEPNRLLCMQARFYSPIFRRFLSEDPAGFSGGINLYSYTGGDPINLIDPFGLGPVDSSNLFAGLESIFTGFAEGLQDGFDNFNNTVTFGLYDYMGWSTSFDNVGWENDLSRSFATIPRDVALGATISSAYQAVARTVSSAFSSFTSWMVPATNVTVRAESSLSGHLLGQDLLYQEAASAFTATGQLSPGAIAGSRVIIPAGQLGNPSIPAGFSKMSTRTFQSPSGNFQVHYYQNTSTGAIDYSLDYKIKFN